jgi:hypothetical protein
MEFNSFLNLPPLVLGYFLGYALSSREIIPKPEAIPKKYLNTSEGNYKNQSPFFKDKNKKEV